ncbi:MAG: molybdopterin-guanine dinucleotide biosynthesis protein B [Methanosarcinales archaeon Met12]|nr:MAG: molybdopterin-guanine dinucleotide biosynthesis protein B [Methanosarcinales archaeon Met12]
MILGVYGYSKTGKTVLITELTQRLTSEGYDIVTIKHIPHEDFTVDAENKDTWLHAHAGASAVVASSPAETAFIVKSGMELERIIEIIQKSLNPDLILVEGYKDEDMPKIAVGDIEEKPNTVFRYDGDLGEVLQYIKRTIGAEKINKQMPGLNCGKCGLECAKMAELIYDGEKNLTDCPSFSQLNVMVEADGEGIPLGHFTRELIANVINGILSSLKGTADANELKIILRR